MTAKIPRETSVKKTRRKGFLLILAAGFLVPILMLGVSQAGVLAAEREVIAPVDMFTLGMVYYEKQNYQEALKWFKRGASEGHVESMLQIGMMYDFGIGVERNSRETLKWYLCAASKQNAQGLYLMGHMYEYGEAVELDFVTAKWWYQRAADLGNASAQYLMAKFRIEGNEGKTDAVALKLLTLAAAKCHAAALRDLEKYFPRIAKHQKELCEFK